MSFSAVNVSNNILKRSFDDGVGVSPMKLQKILYFAASEYAKRTGTPLLTESFQAWRYGPVVRSVYDEFRTFGGGSIRAFGKDARGRAYIADESRDGALRDVLDAVWAATRSESAVSLSRITHLPGSAWDQAYTDGRNAYLDDERVRQDTTYVSRLGLPAT